VHLGKGWRPGPRCGRCRERSRASAEARKRRSISSRCVLDAALHVEAQIEPSWWGARTPEERSGSSRKAATVRWARWSCSSTTMSRRRAPPAQRRCTVDAGERVRGRAIRRRQRGIKRAVEIVVARTSRPERQLSAVYSRSSWLSGDGVARENVVLARREVKLVRTRHRKVSA